MHAFWRAATDLVLPKVASAQQGIEKRWMLVPAGAGNGNAPLARPGAGTGGGRRLCNERKQEDAQALGVRRY